MKKLRVLFLLLIMTLSFLCCDAYLASEVIQEETDSTPIDVNAAVLASGNCGDSMTWSLSDNGDMVISGTGEMWDLWPDNSGPNERRCPWESYKDKIITLTIGNGVRNVGEGAFSECVNLKSVIFPDTLIRIDHFAFLRCKNLGNFTLPYGLTYLGQEAFHDCDSITSLIIPDTVNCLMGSLCLGADSLTYVYIGGEEIPSYIHASGPIGYAPLLEKIEVSEANIALKSIDGVLYTKDGMSLVEYPSGKKDKTYTVNQDTKEIAQTAFNGAVYLEELILPEELECIRTLAVWNCQELTALMIPATVVEAEKNAVYCCWNLLYIENKSQTKLDICEVTNTIWTDANGNRVTEIGTGIYYQCRGISKIEVDEYYNLNVGESVQLPENFEYNMLGYKETKSDLLFSSSNTSVIKIDEEGNAQAVGKGTAVVTIAPKYVMEYVGTIESLTVSCVITVDGDGVLTEGWQQDEYGWKYLKEDGTYATNCWHWIDGGWYAFDEDSYMREGWFFDGAWYFLRYGSGTMATGWVQDGGAWYYMHESGVMATGWIWDGAWYYMNSSGVMATGWIFDGAWYYMNPSGVMATGWVNDGGTWYYMNSSGVMATGWIQDGSTWYYMYGSGAMATGWVFDSGNWYYLHGSGAMATGWIQDGGNWYYLYDNGVMARDTWIGDDYVDESGVWIP